MADDFAQYGDLPYVMSGLPRRRNPYDARRQMAMSMVQGGMDFSPVQHPLQGASRLAQALVGSLMMRNADSQEAEADKARQEAFGKIAGIADPQERIAALGKIDPEAGAKYAGQIAMQELAAKREADARREGAGVLANMYGTGGGAPQGGPQQAAMPPEQAKAQAMQHAQYLIQNHGFSPEQAAAMVGNLYQESGFNPTAVHDNGTGFGMGGWRLERRDALLNFAKQAGRDPRDPQTQLDFFATELKGRPEFQQFQQAQTPQDRQNALMTYFRPAGWTPQTPQAGHGYGNRVQFAQTFAGGQPQVAQGDNVQPGARPVADGSGNPMPPIVPPDRATIAKPEADPDVVRRAMALSQMPKSAGGITLGEAERMIEQDRMERWKLLQGDANERRKQADTVAAEDRRAEAAAARVGPEALLRGAAERYIKDVRPKAENAVQDIAGIHQIRQLLDAGAFTGTLAEAKTYLAKLGELVGMSPTEAATNTQVLGAQLANRVLAGMGGSLGAGFSNADRDFVEKAKGGQIAMTETALRRLMDIGERQAKMTLDLHGREVERFKRMPEMGRMTGSGYFDLPPVQSYQEWSKANPLAPTNPQQGGQSQGQQMPTIGSPEEAMRLPKGTRFRDPQGNIRVVP